jgi:superfamily II DNA or RNA helicase
MLVLHANWMDGSLHLWGEVLEQYVARRGAAAVAAASDAPNVRAQPHHFALGAAELRDLLSSAGAMGADARATSAGDHRPGEIRLQLPCDWQGPRPSDVLARLAEGAAGEDGGEPGRGGDRQEHALDPYLGQVVIETVAVPAAGVIDALLRLEQAPALQERTIELGQDARYWIAVATFIADLLADQRFIPTLLQGRGHEVTAAWQPWLHDEDARARVGVLLTAMPPVVRAVTDGTDGRPWSILAEALRRITDATVRAALAREQFIDALEGRDRSTDPHVAWLGGLLDRETRVEAAGDQGATLLRDATQWVARLDDSGQGKALRLCLRLNEPAVVRPSPPGELDGPEAGPLDHGRDAGAPQEAPWMLTLHLQSPDDPQRIIDAAELWGHASSSGQSVHVRGDQPQEVLLAELGRAARVYPKLEAALSQSAPASIALDTAEAHEFLRDVRPVLEEEGVVVLAPSWWDQPIGRLAARLQIDAPQAGAESEAVGDGAAPVANLLGLNSLVNYRWQVAIGDQPLTPREFEALARQTAPLVQVRGRWIEISPQQLKLARDFIEKTPSGRMTLLEAIQIAHGLDGARTGLPVHGMDATGWVADVLGASSESRRMPNLDQPPSFVGSLRPYQKTGLSWLAFLDRFGLGACLADDMGLGKTIQLIALMLHERQDAEDRRSKVESESGSSSGQVSTLKFPLSNVSVGPTLLVVPTSVVGNWVRELNRFAPSLRVHVQHGSDRPLGDRFSELAAQRDIVITTYPLVSRDFDSLRRIKWHRVALDEAQYIKNPPTKQTTAIRSLHATRRLALTGTPVENRLSELWSIMEFCNPGYLGAAGEFRRRFALPIERRRDPVQAERLRHMVRPFVLRRVKTDPKVISDLPACLETKEYATLTPEQAALYQHIVNQMLSNVDQAQGIQRRGLVLAGLVRLKQICNHPETARSSEVGVLSSEFRASDSGAASSTDGAARASDVELGARNSELSGLSSRSGKARRLMVMLEEVLAAGDKALIFTQFRQMGHMLTAMIQSDLDAEALFLHGGTPAAKRQGLIDRFQDPSGGAPIFVLSLKAGGLGLNLTAANHVFHFDRWWNPAVENQATDRAFRIGQTRTVHVHKFVCVGTLEERIDQMIEQKSELASNIIGAGESWLTELSTGQLHELLMLRPSATEADA